MQMTRGEKAVIFFLMAPAVMLILILTYDAVFGIRPIITRTPIEQKAYEKRADIYKRVIEFINQDGYLVRAAADSKSTLALKVADLFEEVQKQEIDAKRRSKE